ncbi:NitT/TauT family transport system permease protein [Rhodoplanes tepidamans]|uniref:ABC transporter permease n=2 Tax=Rhodoplanes TaxID=29407 RepID=A0ABT5JD50_RHOTP|nr:ABC transporter permease [Rhodoplanes tepidamans]MDC7787433.1 ABC transporter permease [Rhodoplanes tepidamans]MDQ0358081.1 NitT/TauT family transport system permease protein [Rhodoplanes tepidamans]
MSVTMEPAAPTDTRAPAAPAYDAPSGTAGAASGRPRGATLRRPTRLAGRVLLGLALPVIVLAAWQLAGRGGSLFGGVLPTPDRVWAAWWTWAFGAQGLGLNPYSGTWLANVLYSAERVAKGFGCAILIGVPAGIAIGWNRIAAGALDPTVQILRPIPITAWLPFSIAVFGIGPGGAIFLIALGAFYPIVVNTSQGARDVDRMLIRAALMMGAGPFTILRRVVLPAALPSVFTGLRIGLGIGWTAVIVAEMVAVKSGLGYVLWDAYYVGRMDVVIADMITIGLLGFLSDRLVLAIEHWALAWRRLQSHHA